MEPKAYRQRKRLHYPRTPILFEIACVLCVLGVALYFILGASAHSTASQGPNVPDSSLANATAPAPTPTATASSSALPPWHGPAVQVLNVTPDNSTAKISFKPFPGAKDYRILDVSEPKVVKYAGMAHLEGGPFLMNANGTPVVPFQVSPNGSGPSVLNIPYPQIEWNLLEDGQPHTLVVQAVNQLGPIPPGNLYNRNNAPLVQSNQPFKTLGMNEGATPDGHISINGQGPSTDNPKVIAQSAPFVVQANPNYRTIPSTPVASQAFFDTFPDSEASAFKRVAYSPDDDSARYTLNAGTNKAWTIEYEGADVLDSYPFISGGHFMDVLFDGGTPGTGNPLHTSHGSISLSPDQTANLAAGNVLHITMEVDLHQDGRRWTGIELVPASDPLTNFDPDTDPVNRSDKALFFNDYTDSCDFTLYTGPSDGANSTPKGIPLWGSVGQADNVCDTSNFYWGGMGINLDNRGKLDLFISQTHAALFMNGQLVIESSIPGGLPFTKAKVYFTHYVYHTANDINELKQYRPWETFWINHYSYSDERHWDNMGFEVFPSAAASTSAAWQKLVALPHAVAPKLVALETGNQAGASVTNPAGSPAEADIPSRSIE